MGMDTRRRVRRTLRIRSVRRACRPTPPFPPTPSGTARQIKASHRMCLCDQCDASSVRNASEQCDAHRPSILIDFHLHLHQTWSSCSSPHPHARGHRVQPQQRASTAPSSRTFRVNRRS
eukprot:1009804-Rhodomonas_salina.1